jgi:hypothetical protein
MAKGNAMWGLGRRREAFGLAYAARDLAAQHSLTDIQLRVMGNLANSLTETDVQASLEASNEALQIARKAGRRGQLIQYIGNLGYTAFLAGEWDFGLKELDAYLADDLASRDRLIMSNNASIIRVSRGESIDDAVAEMRHLGEGMSGTWELFVMDPEANRALATGDLDTARSKFLALAEEDPGVGMEYFYRAAIPASWARDIAQFKEILGKYIETGDFGPVSDARKATLDGAKAALDGRPAEALPLFKDGLRGWRATHSVWDEALAGITAAELLDTGDPAVAEIVASTRAILERLRAKPYLERLDAAVARGSGAAPSTTRSRTKSTPEVAVTE